MTKQELQSLQQLFLIVILIVIVNALRFIEIGNLSFPIFLPFQYMLYFADVSSISLFPKLALQSLITSI